MKPFNRKMDFRVTETNVAKRIPAYCDPRSVYQPPKLKRQSDLDYRDLRFDDEEFTSGYTSFADKRVMSQQEISQGSPDRSANPNRRPKVGSRERLRETSAGRESPEPYKYRTTFTSNSLLPPNFSPQIGQHRYAQPIQQPYAPMRKSYDLGAKEELYDNVSERSRQLSSIEQTLNNLSCKVFNAKKELEKKNDRHKEQRFQPRYIILEQDECPPSKEDQESQKSQESTNTIRKSPSVRISSLVQSIPKPKDSHGFETNPYSPRKHNIYYVSEIIRAISDRNSIAREHLVGSIKILKFLENEQLPSYSDIEHRKLNLPKRQQYRDKKTLVFDLDETLIHCNENAESPSDVTLTIKMSNGEQIDAGINIRPYAITLLNQLVKHFELIIFTASHSCYADVVLDYLDPERQLFQHRLYREHCYESDKGMYIKDLRIINRPLSDMVLIDNAAYSYSFQLENGIPILPYYEGSNDFELKALESYLAKLPGCKDVRELNKKTFKLHHYGKFDSPEQLVEELYTR